MLRLSNNYLSSGQILCEGLVEEKERKREDNVTNLNAFTPTVVGLLGTRREGT